MPAPIDVLEGEDRPISRDALGWCCNQKFSLNFLSNNMKENCKLSTAFGTTRGVSPFAKEDIARITLAYIPLESLLIVREVNSHLRHFVNEEASFRLTSDSSAYQPDLNCLVKAMHGTFACRKGCRSLKTLLVSNHS
eukprot:811691-Rhodomonas_salina.3